MIANADEAHAFHVRSNMLPLCLIAQTTVKQTEYEQVIEIFSQKVADLSKGTDETMLKVFKTICPATQKRQDALIKLADECDVLIVVGGKNSTNTNRLFRTAQELHCNCFLVENADELPPQAYSAKIIGLAAGASTPDFVIDAITQKLR